MTLLPLEVCIWSGKLKFPSTRILTISILFSTLDYFTIFSIFWEEMRFTILSRDWSYLSSCAAISIDVRMGLVCFFRVDLRILALRSTISVCLFLMRKLSGIFSSLPLNLVDQILCLANISRECLIWSGRISSSESTVSIKPVLFWALSWGAI